jgi:serine/threonine protein phosphatase PrpC
MPPDPLADPPPSSCPPSPQLDWSGMTHVGRFRANNEDAFLTLAFDSNHVWRLGKIGRASLAGSDLVFAVSDGMGGAHSGEFASRITIEKVTRLLPRGFRRSAGGSEQGFLDILIEIIGAIHHDLTKMGQSYEECAGMGATLSLGWFTPGWMYFSHIGDSRIYHLAGDGQLTQLTQDHSHVGWLRRAGQINEREARTHPRRNALQQVLGAGHQFIQPQLGAVACQPGDRFLFCTDGLVEGLWDRQIKAGLLGATPVSVLAGQLVEEAVQTSGRDNATAVVVAVLPAETA